MKISNIILGVFSIGIGVGSIIEVAQISGNQFFSAAAGGVSCALGVAWILDIR